MRDCFISIPSSLARCRLSIYRFFASWKWTDYNVFSRLDHKPYHSHRCVLFPQHNMEDSVTYNRQYHGHFNRCLNSCQLHRTVILVSRMFACIYFQVWLYFSTVIFFPNTIYICPKRGGNIRDENCSLLPVLYPTWRVCITKCVCKNIVQMLLRTGFKIF